MSQLSAQSILRLCEGVSEPMISPFFPEKRVIRGKSYGLSAASYDVRSADSITLGQLQAKLISTIEDFIIPDNVCGYVCDKSTYARLHVSAFNTLFDPGFRGNATLELVNLGYKEIIIHAGDPICQFVFHWLDEPTDRPYNGKYQNQKRGENLPKLEE